MARLSGKIALVTGAGRGMGKVIAQRLAEEGAGLIVHYGNSKSGADEVVTSVRQRGQLAFAVQANVAHRDEVRHMFEQIDQQTDRVDILVNSAGVSAGTPLHALDEQVVDELIGVNLRGPLYIASEAVKRMRDGGRIVNISSTVVEFPFPGASVYAGAKAAVKAFTGSWAKELAPKGITVNTVIPGATSPGMADSTAEVHRQSFAKASPFGRIGRAEEIASVVAFLCAPEASWVSGAHILANGAATA